MSKTILNGLLMLLWVLIIPACVPGVVATPDPNVIGTAIAQTMAAWTPTSSPQIPVTGPETSTPTLTLTTVPTVETETASSTSTQTVTLTPTLTSIVTSIPATIAVTIPTGAVQISVSVPTNCRVGPGEGYRRVGALQVGEFAEVVGRNSTGNYWIIRNPTRAGETCWLWGQYASLTGDTSALPVFTPPAPPATATPTADFDVFYERLERCTTTGWWVDINVENLGGQSFRSIALTIEDRDNGTIHSLSTNGFIDRTGCSESATYDSLPPDADRTVSSPVFTYDPTGHRLRATIRMCSNTGQGGKCVAETVNITP